ncbi:MAG: hypothetical protein R3E98_18880 [Gemmatimonadota bacterium]
MKPGALLVSSALCALVACGGDAPLSDGSFLTYEVGDSRVRVTFEDAGGGDFRTVGQVTDGGRTEPADGMPGHGEIVDSRLRLRSGAPLEVASFGPIWVPPAELRAGGRVHGSPVTEVRSEGGREVAVVSASLGMGAALRGEWRYDATTGFSVGGSMCTAASGADAGLRFRLVDTNVPGLVVP